MQLLAVTYHYFGDYKTEHPGINSLSAASFEQQIEQLGQYFEFISQDKLLNALREKTHLPERSCILTFDDGVRSQYEVALPVLQKMKVPAVFFVCGLPYAEKKALNIHKIHWLRSMFDPDTFLQKVIAKLDTVNIEFREDMISLDKVSDKFFWDDMPTKKLKYLLNIVLPFPKCKQIIEMIFEECVPSEEKFCANFYMSEAQVMDLHKRYAVGTHTYSHLVLGNHDDITIQQEISKGMDVVEHIIGERPLGVSYPYGYKEAVPQHMAGIALNLGLEYGFTVERSLNTTLKNSLLLARVDANDAPIGKEPLFSFENDKLVPRKHLTIGRTRYFEEVASNALTRGHRGIE